MMEPISEQNNFIYLTVALVLLLFVAAVAEHFPDPITGIFIDATTVATLALGVWSFKAERRWLPTGVGFVAAILIVIVFDLILEITDLHYVQLCIMLVFFVLTAWLAARQVLFTGSIDANKVIGAVCIFLLLGIIWAMLYLLVAGVAPASFNGLDAAKWYDNFPHLGHPRPSTDWMQRSGTTTFRTLRTLALSRSPP
jgi:hypothetical protein